MFGNIAATAARSSAQNERTLEPLGRQMGAVGERIVTFQGVGYTRVYSNVRYQCSSPI